MPETDAWKVKLTVINGPREHSLEFDQEPILIGRHPDNHVVIKDAYVSSWHGKIYRVGSDVIFEDLRSTNGSCIVRGADMLILDGKANSKAVLETKDQICLGFAHYPVILLFECDQCTGPGLPQAQAPEIVETLPPISPELLVSDNGLGRDAYATCYKLWMELNTVFKLSEATRIFARAMFASFPKAGTVMILLREGQRPKYRPVFSMRKVGGQFFEEKAQIGKAVLTHVLKTGESVRLKDGMCVPLKGLGKIHGIVLVENREATDPFESRDLKLLTIMAHQASTVLDRVKSVNTIVRENAEQTMRCLVVALEANDKYTHGHSEAVALYCRLIAEGMGLSNEEANLIFRASLLHDIGKIGVPFSVINKPGRLSDAEYEQMKGHPVVGTKIIEPIESLREIIPIVRHHHERYDGRGYPDRLTGEGIPLGARILAVADTYHAMTSDRPYRKGLSHEVAVQELLDNAGTQFDPKVVQTFVREMERVMNQPAADGTQLSGWDVASGTGSARIQARLQESEALENTANI